MKDLIRKQLEKTIATMQAVAEDARLAQTLADVAALTAARMQSGNKLLVAGNGGSAADAQHLVAEFVVRLNTNRRALPAIALTTDSSVLTAIGNDFGFEQVFARQIEAFAQPGDVFLAISTSGNSPDLLCGMRAAREMGVVTVGLLGRDGGQMRGLCDYQLVIPSIDTMHIQEAHLALEHIFCMLVERCYFGESFPDKP